MKKIFRHLSDALLFVVLSSAPIFAQGLIIKTELDPASVSSLSSTEKSYAANAYNRFLKDILMVPEISVRTSDVDATLREIQKKSQIDAGIGMGSDEAAYASDKGSRAGLAMQLSMNRVNGSFSFVCRISEIESMNLVGTVPTSPLPITQISDAVVDKFAYDVLLVLQQRKYISVLSADVINQLLNKDTSAANFEKYIKDYTAQIEAAEREKQALESGARTASEMAEAADQARALQLKIEMLEKSRQQAQENLRRQLEAEALAAMQKKELEAYQAEKQAEFQRKVRELEEMRNKIRQEATSQLSLKQRIELIETSKASLASLKKQLEDGVKENNSFFDLKADEEMQAKQNEPWRRGETDANGKPTSIAKKMRSQELKDIKEKYASAKKSSESELRSKIQPSLDAYEEQIDTNIAELEKTTYVFRSIDVTDDFLSLSVDEYDADAGSWTVHSGFKLDTIPKTDISGFILPDAEIPYRVMTGKNLPNLSNPSKEAYDEYLDLVDMADLYFRTSIPYLYSELALNVTYKESADRYEVYPSYFRIHKTEDRTRLFEYKKTDFDGEKRKAKAAATASAAEEKKRAAAEKKAAAQSGSSASAASGTKKGGSSVNSFLSKQNGRNGVFGEAGYMQGSIFQGVDFNAHVDVGNDFWFVGWDFDIGLLEFNQDLSLAVSSHNLGLFGTDIYGGLCVTLGNFQPYAFAGLGVAGFSTMKTSDGKEDPRFAMLFGVGCDYSFDLLTVGFVYRWKWVHGCGFMDGYNLTVGFTW